MAALDWMGLSDRRRRPRRVAVAATAAAAAAAVATVIVVEATLGAASVSGAPTGHALSAHVRPLPGVTRAEAAGRSPNSSADPRTVAWVESLRAAAAAELPPLPSPDLFRRHDGLYTLHAGIGLAAGQVLLEVPKDQLEQPFRLFREFTAVDAAATEVLRRVDDTSVELTDRLLAFRLAPNTAPLTLELYRPPLRKRSVDPASMPGRQAVAGISSTTLQSFPARSLDGGRLLIDVSPLVASTFHLSEYAGWSSRFVAGTAHLRQVSFSIDTANAGGVGGFLTVTAVGLPRQRMVPRTLDDRIGYFASTYQWIDDYAGDKPAASGANIVKWVLRGSVRAARAMAGGGGRCHTVEPRV